jgi:hypothetical protein
MSKRTNTLARPFRNSGLRYTPKRSKPELAIQLRLCTYLRKNYPTAIFHSDYAANADLSKNQQKINSALQSRHKFPDLIIFARGRINPKTGQPYIGLAIELKNDGSTVILKVGPNKGKLTSNEHIREQAKTLRTLNEQGWYANFAIGYTNAQKLIDWYFRNESASLF